VKLTRFFKSTLTVVAGLLLSSPSPQSARGAAYIVQRSVILPATNWVTIKSVLGNGANTNVLDATASSPQNVYRVQSN
jgi:hypothetical protein